MRWLGKICFLVLASGLAVAQNAPSSAPSDKPSVADEMKALRDAVVQQQELINQQQQQIDTLKKALQEETAATPHVEDAALHTNAPVNAKNNAVQGDEKPKESPLSFRIGGTEFTPGGFVDFENVFRSTNTTNNISTAFQAIPFSNSVTGHLTEYRSTGQYSRFNLKITGQYGANNVTGYIEGDFNGNNATNVYTTANANTARLRLYWVDVKRGKWEFLGGQSWGLMTPNRVGVSPMPQDLLITYNEDANIQVGINYTRSGAFRAVWHPSDNFAWALGIENPEQFISTASFPANTNFGVQLTSQFNPINNSNGTPNVAPDVVTKMAFDGNPGGRHMHFEVGGILTSAKITFLPSVTGATFQHATNVGGGIQGGFVASVTKNFRVVGNGLWGPGVGRYNIGMGPQVIVRPTNFGGTCAAVGVIPNAATVNCGLALSPVHSANGLLGLELQATPKTLFGAYYGAAYFSRNTFIDVTSTTVLGIPISCAPGFPFTTHPCAGYGSFQSGQSNNRAIQEPTFDWTQTFWRNPQYGAVLLVTQYSYLTRSPWFVANGAPKNAHLSMGFLSLRYVLP
jgi:hypothetical protein